MVDPEKVRGRPFARPEVILKPFGPYLRKRLLRILYVNRADPPRVPRFKAGSPDDSRTPIGALRQGRRSHTRHGACNRPGRARSHRLPLSLTEVLFTWNACGSPPQQAACNTRLSPYSAPASTPSGAAGSASLTPASATKKGPPSTNPGTSTPTSRKQSRAVHSKYRLLSVVWNGGLVV